MCSGLCLCVCMVEISCKLILLNEEMVALSKIHIEINPLENFPLKRALLYTNHLTDWALAGSFYLSLLALFSLRSLTLSGTASPGTGQPVKAAPHPWGVWEMSGAILQRQVGC